MSSSDAVIQATSLCKSFGDIDVLRGVDLSVPRGSIVGLLGTNGAGKSTFIKCLLGLLKITSGTATVFGEDAWNLSADAKSRLGYVPQVVKFYPWMNVRQMIDYTGAYYPNWDADFCNQMVSDWDLKEKEKVSSLSTGQQQRLGLILAMGHRPELLVLDEPAASLDPQGRRSLLRSLMDQNHDRQHTVLFSTHITSDLERVASHVAILRDGIVDFFGELEDLKDSVKRLRIHSSTNLPQDFTVPAALRTEIEGSSAVAAVATADDHLVARLEQEWNVSVTVEDLNLEDIFLELHDEHV